MYVCERVHTYVYLHLSAGEHKLVAFFVSLAAECGAGEALSRETFYLTLAELALNDRHICIQNV